MSTYAIGDIQGCYDELSCLLEKIRFDPALDRLWFAGDLVNRGPQSLATLRLVHQLRKNCVVVLGNHDLHLLACAYIERFKPGKKDTFDDVIDAEDAPLLLDWLRRQPLLWRDEALGFAMVHAGVPHVWTLSEAADYAAEVEEVLRGEKFVSFLDELYGNTPNVWRDDLSGWDRMRLITNYLTRLRFIAADGAMDFNYKGAPGSQPSDLQPWHEKFKLESHEESIVFGHWSALHITPQTMRNKRIYALDTGAVWGGYLTAMRLEDGRLFNVPSTIALPISD